MEPELQALLALQRQRFKRQVIRLGDTYPIGPRDPLCESYFLREVPIACGGVGAGLWEAGEMMARWVHRHRDRVTQVFDSSLELGSGTGAVGLVVGSHIQTVLSDYRAELLANLAYNLWVNGDAEGKEELFGAPEQFASFARNAGRLARNARIAHIDWFRLDAPRPADGEPEAVKLLPPTVRRLELADVAGRQFPLVYGSELNYCMETVEALADAVDRYLAPDGVFWEIISVYRGPGVRAFMDEMRRRGYVVECRRAPAWLYAGLRGPQRRRGEEYMLWTLYRAGHVPPMRFGDGELVDWQAMEYELCRPSPPAGYPDGYRRPGGGDTGNGANSILRGSHPHPGMPGCDNPKCKCADCKCVEKRGRCDCNGDECRCDGGRPCCGQASCGNPKCTCASCDCVAKHGKCECDGTGCKCAGGQCCGAK